MRFPLLFSLVMLATASTPLRGEKPFDFESTPGKLPKHVVPEEYAIRITPDAKKLTFTGSETIRVNVRKPTRELVLNAAEIEISKAAINDKPVAKSAIKLDPKEETLTITAPAELQPGTHTLSLSFSGKINTAGQGLYHAPYTEQGTGEKKVMLGTQMEATDARRMFPCWDEPVFRARFQLTAIVPENWTAVSNMPLERETKTAAGKELHFGLTPSMASYLNVLCAGELDSIEKKSHGVLHRVVATRGKAELGRYALDSSAQVTEYFNDYFGTPYPLPKLDEIAVPGGFGGAMENWGGITYFESRLLYDPQRSSAETKQNIYEVIAHEIAHQWFGNLVTMAWWDNLWLNEGFASWMGSKCTEKFNPDWEVWLTRDVPRNPTRRTGIPKETAMESDARSTTHPIQQPVATEAEANSAFDDITYKKGQSFIRMLESFLGEEVFRDGIRKYTARHKFSNTTTADLWNALGEASGKPVVEIAAGWTQQPGFPIVTVSRGADGKVALTQERFTINYPNAPALEWKIPLTYTVSGGADGGLLMESKTAELTDIPPDRAFKLNVEGAGNYRVQYDEASWKLILAHLAKFSSPDRVNLLSDAWALVQAKRAPLSHYLEIVEKLPTRTELAEREQIMTAFGVINSLLAEPAQRQQFHQYARSILRPSFDALGWDPKPGEKPREASLRVSLIPALASFGDEEIAAGCQERFRRFLEKPESLAPDLRAPVLSVIGRYADEATWTKLHELGRKTTSIEEKQNYYDALSAAADPKLAERALQIALSDELPSSRAAFLVPKVARDGGHADLVWRFAKANMKQLLAKTDALGALSYAPSLFTFFSDTARLSELKDYAKTSLSAEAAKEVDKAVDEVSFRADFKQQLANDVASWKTAQPRG
ncbi:MAG: Putative aminopeptidase [uncultured Chthoniobacterales bacterium]|uniref:Aminopeptidase n=1 Tax=uncultured Chthoniobacterales bacterium TaxID=1836801 RepID=A0A6J4H0F8_9BACT|nr:MAG: Putative aminopeptidase [uncultured Chthoniobacterales bacterium]